MSLPVNVIDTLTNNEGATISNGMLVRVSGNGQFRRAQADTAGNIAGYIGVLRTAGPSLPNSSRGILVVNGLATVLLQDGLSPAAGNSLWISPTVTGRATTVQPGSNAVHVGVIKDASRYGTDNTVQATLGAPAAAAGGGSETLSQTYDLGSSGADQTMSQTDARGGTVTFDASDAGFTQERSTEWIPSFAGRRTVVHRSGHVNVFDENPTESEGETALLTVGPRPGFGVNVWVKAVQSDTPGAGVPPRRFFDNKTFAINTPGQDFYRVFGSVEDNKDLWRKSYQLGVDTDNLNTMYVEQINADEWVTVLRGQPSTGAIKHYEFDNTKDDFAFDVTFGRAGDNINNSRLNVTKDVFLMSNIGMMWPKEDLNVITAASQISLRTSGGFLSTFYEIGSGVAIDFISFAEWEPSITAWMQALSAAAPVVILRFRDSVTLNHFTGGTPVGHAPLFLEGGINATFDRNDLICLAFRSIRNSSDVAVDVWMEMFRKVLPTPT